VLSSAAKIGKRSKWLSNCPIQCLRSHRVRLPYILNFYHLTEAFLRWYIFTIVDIFFHETSLRAAYGYIMLYFVITLEKLAADILILTGTLRIFSCLLFRRLRTPLPWIHIGEFLIILLVITALYDLGSYFAHQVLWINIADDDIIADVSSRKDKFEAAFFILQWLLTLSMFIAVTYVVLLLKSEPPVSVCSHFENDNHRES
jgi:hypothetical protein